MTNQYVSKNRMAPGGDTWIIGGELKRDGAIDGDESQALHVGLPVHYQIAPAAISATAVHAAIALTAGTQQITTAITNPDVPRTLTIKGNAAGIAGNVVIHGTNAKGEVITDTIALNGATEVEGVKAFAGAVQIDLPAETHAGTDTVSVGWAKKLGLPHIVDNAALLLVKLFDGAADAGTLAVDADEVEKNLYALAGVPNGAKLVDLYYLK
jgi:hypothetical protein